MDIERTLIQGSLIYQNENFSIDHHCRYEEAHDFDEENIKYLNMNVPMMLRYYWYGTFSTIKNGTVIDMEKVNRAWIDSGGVHDNFIPIVY